MNDEKPRLRSDAFSSSASPSAPLCEENPIGPGGSARGPNVAFSDGAETAMPRQFGPDETAAVRADEREQLLLALAAFLADLGEPRRDHAERADPGLAARTARRRARARPAGR